jgi:hypothetical protein
MVFIAPFYTGLACSPFAGDTAPTDAPSTKKKKKAAGGVTITSTTHAFREA